MLDGKKIVLGVTGGIAVYKAVEIASRLRKLGADVHVIMTRAAKEFVTELTFREITGNPVSSDMFAPVAHYNVEHIALANLADVMLIAPATANVIAKIAHGVADDMLTTTALATVAPIFFAPSMNSNMLSNVATQENIKTLTSRGLHLIEPASGHLACGTSGKGRLPEPCEIVSVIDSFFNEGKSLSGKNVLVTAAGTREPIDPVRYIGNRSSGRMGYALAGEAVSRGASVVLVSGPSSLEAPEGLKKFIKVETAGEMRAAVMSRFRDADIVIKAAAVADYRAKVIAENKIKKNAEEWTLSLEKNPDILKELGEKKRGNQILVGFAAETQNLIENAKAKLEKKNLDFIVANDVTKPNAGFNTETNLIKILSRDGGVEEFPLMKKSDLAKKIFERIEKVMEK